MQVLGNRKKGLAFVLSAPAGTGKSTLVEMLAEEFPCCVKNISFTTRKKRAGEVPGVHYHFIDKPEFEKKIANHELLEYVSLFGDYYGTSKKWINEQLDNGKHVFLVIDTQGAQALKGKFPATFIFVMPPNLDELKFRLEKRKTESPEAIAERLAQAKKEIQTINLYDYNIVNDNLETAYEVLRSIVIAEEHKVN